MIYILKVRGKRQRDGREKQWVDLPSCNQQRVKGDRNDSAEQNGPQFSSRVITHVRLLFKNPAPLIRAPHCSASVLDSSYRNHLCSSYTTINSTRPFPNQGQGGQKSGI